MHVNKVIIVGNLGRDHEARYMPSRIEMGLARVLNAIDASRSRTPANILASVSGADVTDVAADSSGVAGADGGEGPGGGSGDGDSDGDGDPDSDRRRLSPSTPPHSKRKTKSLPAPSGKSRKHRDIHSNSTAPHPQIPPPVVPDRQPKLVQWLAFVLTLAAMGVAVWFAEKGYDPIAASAFAGAFAHCIQTLLKT
ncbi:hypothetical protein ACNSPR_29195 [Klebsiella pneumoniae]